MNIIHTFVKFEDTFSGCIDTRITTVSQLTFDKMKDGIGSTFRKFDKAAQIAYNWKVIEVRQAIQSDYKIINTNL